MKKKAVHASGIFFSALLSAFLSALLACSFFAPVVPYDELDEALEILESPDPSYPQEAREQGMEGTVVLEATVATDGTVQSVEVTESSGYKVLDKVAKNALKDWVFSEPTRDGEPVRTLVTVPFTFILER